MANEDVNGNNGENNGGTPPAAAVPATDLAARVAEALKPDFEGKLSAALAEIERLKSERATQNETIEARRLELAVAQARHAPVSLNSAQNDIKLHKAVEAVGGPALWHSMTLEQQAAAIGVEGVETKDSEITKFFGAKSSGMAANALAKSDPARYSRLRQIAKLRGIL